MATLSDYVSGTISLTNGSIDFTGSATGWLLAAFKEGDTIIDITGATEFMGVIAEITSNTAGKLTKAWEGPNLVDAPYRMRYQSDNSRVAAQSRNLIELLGNGNLQAVAGLAGSANHVIMFTGPGTMTTVPKTELTSGADYDVQVSELADRAAYDGQTVGFAVLVSDVGDGRSAIYSKASNTGGDWTDPAFVTGPVGPLPDVTVGVVTTGLPGTDVEIVPTPTDDGVELSFVIPAGEGFVYVPGGYDDEFAYGKGYVINEAGSAWITLQPTTGNAPPTLPTTSNAYWGLLAKKGQDGTGTGDVVGPASSVDSRMVEFDGPTGKLLKDSGVVVSAFAKTLLDDADAGAARTTLGVINKAGDTGVGTLTFDSAAREPTWNGLGAATSKAANGYLKLPNGVIIQWGSGFNGSIPFPITFPTAVWSIATNVYGDAANHIFSVLCDSLNVTGFNAVVRYINTSNGWGTAGQGFRWIAIGN